MHPFASFLAQDRIAGFERQARQDRLATSARTARRNHVGFSSLVRAALALRGTLRSASGLNERG